MKFNYNLISSIISLVRMYFRHAEQNIMNAGERSCQAILCFNIALLYLSSLYVCVEALQKEGEGGKKEKKMGGKRVKAAE